MVKVLKCPNCGRTSEDGKTWTDNKVEDAEVTTLKICDVCSKKEEPSPIVQKTQGDIEDKDFIVKKRKK